MSRAAATGARFQVLDRYGRRVLSGRVGRDVGEWNATYKYVYQLDLSALKVPGSHRVEVPGVACPPDASDRYSQFTGHGSRYVDDVRSWQTAEPADDFAAIAIYALTR